MVGGLVVLGDRGHAGRKHDPGLLRRREDVDVRRQPVGLVERADADKAHGVAGQAYDRGAKFAAYRRLESLQEYLLVDVDARRLELFRREPVGWVLHEVAPADAGLDGVLHLASIDLGLSGHDAFDDLQA